MINVALLNKYVDKEYTKNIVEGLCNNGFRLEISEYDSETRYIPPYFFIKDKSQVFIVPQNSKDFDMIRIQTPEDQIDLKIYKDKIKVSANSAGWGEYKYLEIVKNTIHFYTPGIKTYRGEINKRKDFSVKIF